MATALHKRAELVAVRTPAAAPIAPPEPPRRGQRTLSDTAYEKLEDLLVCCALPPGRYLAMQELQAMVGLGRTPVHQAVNRLAGDTLVVVTPRLGLRIAPIDLTRERLLLRLRREIERFVIRLATERSGASQRNRMLHIKRQLVEHGASMSIEQFNLVDRMIDRLFLAAADEPYVEGMLRPLHTIFRRIGWLYHMQTGQRTDLQDTIQGHIAVIDAVSEGRVEAAIAASDALMDFVEGMFDVLEREVSPALLDCSLGALEGGQFRPGDGTA